MSNNKNYSKSVTTICDTAFVPDGHDNEVVVNGEVQRPSAEKMWADFLAEDNTVISAPFKVKPECIKNGEHKVKIYEITPRQSKDASQPDYVIIDFADEDTRQIWSTIVSMDSSFGDWLYNINMYNVGIINGLTRSKAVGKLQTTAFKVWTVKDLDKKTNKVRVNTYVDEERYNRKCFAMQMNESRKNKDPWED